MKTILAIVLAITAGFAQVVPAGTTDPSMMLLPGSFEIVQAPVEARVFGFLGQDRLGFSFEIDENAAPVALGYPCSVEDGFTYVFIAATLSTPVVVGLGLVAPVVVMFQVDPWVYGPTPPFIHGRWFSIDGTRTAYGYVTVPGLAQWANYVVHVQSCWWIPNGVGTFGVVFSPVFDYVLG